MQLSQLPSELRKLAAQIELAGFDQDTPCGLTLWVHGPDSRGVDVPEELQKWSALMGPGASVDPDSEALQVHLPNHVDITVFYASAAIVSELVGAN